MQSNKATMTQGVTEFERIWGKKQPYASKKKMEEEGLKKQNCN